MLWVDDVIFILKKLMFHQEMTPPEFLLILGLVALKIGWSKKMHFLKNYNYIRISKKLHTLIHYCIIKSEEKNIIFN